MIEFSGSQSSITSHSSSCLISVVRNCLPDTSKRWILKATWQAWHLVTSTFVSRGRRGTWSHPPSFCVAGLALMALGWLWCDTSSLSHTIFHTPLCHTPSFTHHLWHTLFRDSFTHYLYTTSFTHYVSHTIFHTQLCHTPSFTYHFVTHHLWHTIFHTQLCHTPSFTHRLWHTTLSHTIFDAPSFTHHPCC